MDNPKSTRRFPLRSMLLHLSVDGALTAAVLLAAYVGREVTRQVVDSGWLATFAGQLEKLVFLAVITSFSVKAFSEISFDIYSSLKKGLSNAWFRTVQFRWTVGREVFSHALGILGFAVVYALFHRAEAVDNLLARGMIYLAALLLLGEVVYMVAAAVRDRVLLAADIREAVPQ